MTTITKEKKRKGFVQTCVFHFWLPSEKLCCTKVGYLPMAVHQHQRARSSSSSLSLSSSTWFSERSLWWQSVLLTDKMRAFLFLWIFVLLLLHVAGGGQRDEPARSAGKGAGSDAAACSRLCQCEANAVDCSNRGLTQVPLDLPKDADKM